jgi:hypothetical protein
MSNRRSGKRNLRAVVMMHVKWAESLDVSSCHGEQIRKKIVSASEIDSMRKSELTMRRVCKYYKLCHAHK